MLTARLTVKALLEGKGAIPPGAPLPTFGASNLGEPRSATVAFFEQHKIPKDETNDRNGSARLAPHGLGYPLFDALYGRRTRRFGLGFEMAQGPYKYKSPHAPVP